MRTIALETFKIIHKKSPLFLQDLVTIKNNIYNFRYINTADSPRPRTTKHGKNSFRYEAARLWNTLQSEVRNMSSFDQFKNYISDWCGGEKCFCSSCKHQAVLSHAWIVSCLITYFICIICVCLLFIWSNLLMWSYLLFI